MFASAVCDCLKNWRIPPKFRLFTQLVALLAQSLGLSRHLGSAKFGSFLILAAVLSKSIEVALCVQFPFFRPPLGPLAVMSALASTYYGETNWISHCNDFDLDIGTVSREAAVRYSFVPSE